MAFRRPIELNEIIHDGIPDVLRGEVWQLLAKVYIDADLVQTYRMLLDKVFLLKFFLIIFRNAHQSK